MEIKHTLKEPRSLADPVVTAGYTRELHLRDVCWKQANSKCKALNHIYNVEIELTKQLIFWSLSAVERN